MSTGTLLHFPVTGGAVPELGSVTSPAGRVQAQLLGIAQAFDATPSAASPLRRLVAVASASPDPVRLRLALLLCEAARVRGSAVTRLLLTAADEIDTLARHQATTGHDTCCAGHCDDCGGTGARCASCEQVPADELADTCRLLQVLIVEADGPEGLAGAYQIAAGL